MEWMPDRADWIDWGDKYPMSPQEISDCFNSSSWIKNILSQCPLIVTLCNGQKIIVRAKS